MGGGGGGGGGEGLAVCMPICMPVCMPICMPICMSGRRVACEWPSFTPRLAICMPTIPAPTIPGPKASTCDGSVRLGDGGGGATPTGSGRTAHLVHDSAGVPTRES